VVFNQNPSKEARFLRKKEEIKQSELAKEMGIKPSVLSDYESRRRKSPGS